MLKEAFGLVAISSLAQLTTELWCTTGEQTMGSLAFPALRRCAGSPAPHIRAWRRLIRQPVC